MQGLAALVDFYPRHIEKEDKHFFLPCMEYFSDEEQKSVLEEEQEFDRGFIHRLYKERIEGIEQQSKQAG
jgi:hemerythrin-like domain-containing protein